MREFFTATFKVVSVFCLDSILDSAGHWIVNAQDRTLYELDFSSCVSLQRSRWRCLPLSPSFGRACFAPRVWRGWPTGDTVRCARIVQCGTSKTTTSTTVRVVVRRHVRGSIGIIGLCQIVGSWSLLYGRCAQTAMTFVEGSIEWTAIIVVEKGVLRFVFVVLL